MINNNAIITIFTPTYNRERTIVKLYNSLVSQTDKRFKWLIIDDGSSDNTNALVSNWIEDNKIQIIYHYQANQGKSFAYNVAIELADTDYFTCVDSDDYLAEDAIACILQNIELCTYEDVGLLIRRAVTKISNKLKEGEVHTTLINAYRKYGLKGDTMLVYKMQVIKKYRFPVFENEKFVPEDYLYDKIDQDGTLLFVNRVLYYGDYLDNGYTRNMARLIKNNAKGYEAYISQRLKYDDEFKYKVFDTARYIAIEKSLSNSIINIVKKDPIISLLALPLGFYLYFSRYM